MIPLYKSIHIVGFILASLSLSSWISADDFEVKGAAEAVADAAIEDVAEIVADIAVEAAKDVAIVEEKVKEKVPPASQILFNNGDNIHGDHLSANDFKTISLTSDQLNQPANFAIQDIQAVQFGRTKTSSNIKETARIELQNRYNRTENDIIIGELLELTTDHIIIKSSHSGKLKIKRPMVKSFQIMPKGAGTYYGPNNINEWTASEKFPKWSLMNQKFISEAPSVIGKAVGLAKHSHISFQVSYEQQLNFALNLYSDKPESKSPSTGYAFRLTTNNASIQPYGKQVNPGGGMRKGSQRIQLDNIKKSARIDLYANTNMDIIHLYIDGNQSCTLNLPKLENLGDGISLVNQSASKVIIQNIRVTPWDGTNLPKDNTETSDQPDIITLKNGDEVPGKVGKVKDNFMMVETDYTPINIPLDKIKSLNLATESEQPIMKNGDIRVSLNNGSRIVIQLSKLDDTHLSGYGQAIGDVDIDLSTIRRIDFNIYPH